MTTTKTKSWNRLDIQNTRRVSLSPITPRCDCLVAEKHAQGSRANRLVCQRVGKDHSHVTKISAA